MRMPEPEEDKVTATGGGLRASGLLKLGGVGVVNSPRASARGLTAHARMSSNTFMKKFYEFTVKHLGYFNHIFRMSQLH